MWCPQKLASSGWKAAERDLLFLAHKIDSAPVFNLNGEETQRSADQTEMQSLFWGKNRARTETCGRGCNPCGSSAKNGDGMITDNHKSSYHMAGGCSERRAQLIQKNKIHPANHSWDKRNQPEWFITGFPRCVIVRRTCRALRYSQLRRLQKGSI